MVPKTDMPAVPSTYVVSTRMAKVVVATDWYIAGTPVRMMDTRT